MLACGGSDGPTNNRGVIQLSEFAMRPQIARCGVTPTNPPSWAVSPDTVALEATLVNTTEDDITLSVAGTAGTIIRTSMPEDLGQIAATFPSVPYTPKDGSVPSKVGAVSVRASLPVQPLCQAKPVGYTGWREIDISLRITTSVGQYITIPATLHVSWD